MSNYNLSNDFDIDIDKLNNHIFKNIKFYIFKWYQLTQLSHVLLILTP